MSIETISDDSLLFEGLDDLEPDEDLDPDEEDEAPDPAFSDDD